MNELQSIWERYHEEVPAILGDYMSIGGLGDVSMTNPGFPPGEWPRVRLLVEKAIRATLPDGWQSEDCKGKFRLKLQAGAGITYRLDHVWMAQTVTYRGALPCAKAEA